MTRDEAKKHFWADTDKFGESVFKKFGGINYIEFVSSYYIGSEIDNFIDKIYDEHEKELEELQNKDNKKNCEECYKETNKVLSLVEQREADAKHIIIELTRELEELQNKTCKNCKYSNLDLDTQNYWCSNSENASLYNFQTPLDEDFGCNRCEIKKVEL